MRVIEMGVCACGQTVMIEVDEENANTDEVIVTDCLCGKLYAFKNSRIQRKET